MDQFVVVFIGNILIYSRTEGEHEDHFRIVLQIFRKKQLYAKFIKCEFWLEVVTFLGHFISSEGIQVDPKKFEPVIKWKQSKNVS